MAGRGFRFLHASDLHLDGTLAGVTEVPDHLAELFLDARLLAAEKLIDAAIAERVDFLLLAGHVMDLTAADPRCCERLLRMFHRLHDANVAVYWLDTPDDRIDAWPIAVTLPPNVHRLSAEGLVSLPITIGDQVVATLVRAAADSRGSLGHGLNTLAHSTRFAIATAHGEFTAAQLNSVGIDYWALGGRHDPSEITLPTGVAHYCGSPQGSDVSESGPRGGLFVDVSTTGKVTTRMIATDAARWYVEQVELPSDVDQASLLRLLRERAAWLAEQASGRAVLVAWHLIDGDPSQDTQSDRLAGQLRQGNLGAELLTALRTEFGFSQPPLWSTSLVAVPPETLPSGWYEEDTILGDLLRNIQQHQLQPHLPLDLRPRGRDADFPDDLARQIPLQSADDRMQLLKQVAVLGVDLLRGDRVLSEEQDNWMRDHREDHEFAD